MWFSGLLLVDLVRMLLSALNVVFWVGLSGWSVCWVVVCLFIVYFVVLGFALLIVLYCGALVFMSLNAFVCLFG